MLLLLIVLHKVVFHSPREDVSVVAGLPGGNDSYICSQHPPGTQVAPCGRSWGYSSKYPQGFACPSAVTRFPLYSALPGL